MEGNAEIKLEYGRQMEELEMRLAKLRAKEKKARPQLTIGFWNQRYQLDKKQRNAAKRLDDLAKTAEDGLDDAKAAVERSLKDLETALDVAETRFP